jgi:replicative DNA helicase
MLEDQPTALPSSVHMEIAILGAMMLDAIALQDALEHLRADDFSLDSHQRVYRAIRGVLAEGLAVDFLSVQDYLTDHKELEAIGGPAYLAHLTEGVPRNLNITTYVFTVKDKARLRAAQSIASSLYSDCGDQSERSADLIGRAITELQILREESDDQQLESVGTYLEARDKEETLAERLATTEGINFGFYQADEVIGGAQPNDLIIIAGRPSMGKTAAMLNALWNICVLDGRHAAGFSLEQPKKSAVRRMLSAASRVDHTAMRKGGLRPEDIARIQEREDMLRKSHMYLTDQRGMTVSKIRSKCLKLDREIKLKSGGRERLEIIFIDQLSKLKATDVYRKGMMGREIIGEQMEALKDLAKELHIPVVLLCQLKRGDKKGDNRPSLVDLKDSGDIEEDADVVLLLHRPEYYDRKEEALKGKGEIIVAKNRDGDTKTCHCSYRANILRWEDTKEHAARQGDMDDYFVDPPTPPIYGGDRVKW